MSVKAGEDHPSVGEDRLREVAAGQVTRFVHRAVAWDSGERVGFAMISYLPGADEATAHVLVAPTRRRHGVGSALFTNLLAAAAGVDLMTWMPDDDPVSRETAEHWGFRVVSHAIRSRLDLTPGMPRPAATCSLVLEVLDGLAPATRKAGLEVLLDRSATYPEAVELGWKSSVAEFEQMFPGMIWVVLQDRSDAVAVASAQPRRDGPWLVVYTGVLPERRGHGLARLAKQHLHSLAAERGAPALVTDNETNNSEILALNDSLGYQRVGGELRLARTARPV